MPHPAPHTAPSPWPKRIVLTIVALVILFLAYAGLEVYWAFTAKPNPTIDYAQQVGDVVADAQSDLQGPNAWPDFMAMLDAHEQVLLALAADRTLPDPARAEMGFTARGLGNMVGEFATPLPGQDPPTQEQLQQDTARAERYLAALEASDVLARLDALAAAHRYIRPPPPPSTDQMLIQTLLPEIFWMNRLTLASRARMAQARDRGDWTEYARAFEHALTIGRISMLQSFMIDRIVGMRMREFALNDVLADIANGALPPEALPLLVAAIERQSRTGSISVAFETERRAILDSVQWFCDARGRVIPSRFAQFIKGSGFSSFSAGEEYGKLVNLTAPFRAGRASIEREVNDIFDRLAVAVARPNDFDALMSVKHVEWGEANQANPLIQYLLPAIGSAFAKELRHDLTCTGAAAIIAIEGYRAEHGQYPQSLDDLVPQYLPRLPHDPYATEEHSTLGYRHLDEPGPSGQRYLLYSVGFDQRDNDGTPHAEPEKAFTSSGDGTDFIINRAD